MWIDDAKELDTLFTLLESPIIYAGDIRNRKHQLLIEGEVQSPGLSNGVYSSSVLLSSLSSPEDYGETQ